MINKEIEKITEEKEVVKSMTCDICGKTYDKTFSTDNIFEVQEFTHIKFVGGYGSVFGDGDMVECDICQNCLKEKLGEYIRITEGY